MPYSFKSIFNLGDNIVEIPADRYSPSAKTLDFVVPGGVVLLNANVSVETVQSGAQEEVCLRLFPNICDSIIEDEKTFDGLVVSSLTGSSYVTGCAKVSYDGEENKYHLYWKILPDSVSIDIGETESTLQYLEL